MQIELFFVLRLPADSFTGRWDLDQTSERVGVLVRRVGSAGQRNIFRVTMSSSCFLHTVRHLLMPSDMESSWEQLEA